MNTFPPALLAQAKNIRALLLDVDGVLTDGGLWTTEEGAVIKRFDVRDGLGIRLLQNAGVEVALLSGGKGGATDQRARQLGIREVLTGVKDKPAALADLEAILRQPALLPPGCSARSIGAYDFAWTQPGLDKEMRITCNASYYEDNSDSCELWVPGSPLFPLALCVASKDETRQLSLTEFQQTIAGI